MDIFSEMTGAKAVEIVCVVCSCIFRQDCNNDEENCCCSVSGKFVLLGSSTDQLWPVEKKTVWWDFCQRRWRLVRRVNGVVRMGAIVHSTGSLRPRSGV